MFGFTAKAEAGNQLVILTDTADNQVKLMKVTKEPITGYIMQHDDGVWQYTYFGGEKNWSKLYRTQEAMADAIHAL